MLSILLIIGFSLLSPGPLASQYYTVKDGKVAFTSNAPLELIQAATYQIAGIIDTEDNAFAFKVTIASFEGFNSPLQREHFNENYLESAKYPFSSFQGEILDEIDFSRNGTYEEVTVRGVFNIHGVQKKRELLADVIVDDSEIKIISNFLVSLPDHDIKVPRIVRRKLASVINVSLDITMAPR